jgi:hypothetical protein
MASYIKDYQPTTHTNFVAPEALLKIKIMVVIEPTAAAIIVQNSDLKI